MQVKSRYLDPKNKSTPKEGTSVVHSDKSNMQQRRKIMISSSDSSRTSSPAMKRVMDKKPFAKIKQPVKKDIRVLSSDNLTKANADRARSTKDLFNKNGGIARSESPSFKQKGIEIDLSVDSLEGKSKPTTTKKKINKTDVTMSADSLLTEPPVTATSSISNKLSPTLMKATSKRQTYDR